MTKQFDVVNPATEEVIAQVPDTGKDEWLAALGRAVDAQSAWGEFSPGERAEVADDRPDRQADEEQQDGKKDR